MLLRCVVLVVCGALAAPVAFIRGGCGVLRDYDHNSYRIVCLLCLCLYVKAQAGGIVMRLVWTYTVQVLEGSMIFEGALTHPCPGLAVGKPAMVVVRVQPPWWAELANGHSSEYNGPAGGTKPTAV